MTSLPQHLLDPTAAPGLPVSDDSRPDVGERSTRGLRIAMVGLKGLPATYGGIERHVEEIGARLAARGHHVTAYCRTSYATAELAAYRGMTLRRLPTISRKHLDALVHSALATAAAMADRPDIVHYHALGPGLVAPLPRYLSSARVVLTVHGLDNERAKWSRPARAVLGTAHWLSGHVPDATIVVSRSLEEHYQHRFPRPAVMISNGVTARAPLPPTEITSRFGLVPGRYALYVGRLVPEKAADVLVRAWRAVPGDFRLVIAGDSCHTDSYTAELRRLAAADPRVVMTGYVYGDLLAELYSNAAVFTLPSLLEGLPLTLLEAASYARPIVASDIAPHREVIGLDGPGHRLVPPGDCSALTAALVGSLTETDRQRQGAAALRRRVLSTYSWDDAALLTEALYRSLAARPASRGRRTPRPAPV